MSRVLICPYCLDEKTGDEIGCCGESRAHFVSAEVDEETGEIIEESFK